jgi:glycosyltransferase involved in cell wall biosynthesis
MHTAGMTHSDDKSISIIIPVKDEEQNLKRLLPSLLTQEAKATEIIAAIAPSTTDRSREIVERYAPVARWVEGGSPAKGRNAGARDANGQYLFFLDADALPGSRLFLKDAIMEMHEGSAQVATVDQLGHADDLTTVESLFYYGFDLLQRIAFHTNRPFASGTCIIATRNAHLRLHGFDERWAFYEDSDYVQRAKRGGLKFIVLTRRTCVYVDPRRLRKDGLRKVMRMGIRADRYARNKEIISDIRMIDPGYFTYKRQ